MTVKHKFWNFKPVNEITTELLLYGEIASEATWWGDEITPLAFRQELMSVPGNEVCVRINSEGGDVFAASAMYTALKEYAAGGKKVTCKIDGVCASAATIVAMAATKIAIPANAFMMIHKPEAGLIGYYTSDEMTKIAETLEVIKSGIINAYTARTGLSEKECTKLVDAETWMTGKEAVEKGWADELLFDEPKIEPVEGVTNCLAVNGVRLKIAAFAHVPDALMGAINKKSEKGAGEMEFKNSADLKAAFPDFVAEIEGAAREEGAKTGAETERKRIQAIDKMAGTVDPEVLAKAKYETMAAAADVALEALSSGNVINQAMLSAMYQDAEDPNKVNGFANSGQGKDLTEKQTQANFAAKVAAKFFGKDGK